MNVSACPILSAGPGSKPTLKLNQFAYWPRLLSVMLAIYVVSGTYSLATEDRLIGTAFFKVLTMAIMANCMLREILWVTPAHDLTLDGDELVITTRGKITRRPLSTIRHIKDCWFSNGYEVRFQDHRRIRNIKGAGAMEFLEAMSRRSGVEIEE